MQMFPGDDDDYARRLRDAREIAGKSIDEMAALLGISWESYNELEEDDEEITDSVSLRQLVTLSKALNFDLPEFFSSDRLAKADSVSLEVLARKISEYIVTHKLSVDDFEEMAGWEVATCLTNPSRFMNFNLVGLMEVCEVVGVDWRAVLARL